MELREEWFTEEGNNYQMVGCYTELKRIRMQKEREEGSSAAPDLAGAPLLSTTLSKVWWVRSTYPCIP